MPKEKHEFALYVNNLSSLIKTVSFGEDIVIDDEKTAHRIAVILRLVPQDTITFFDRYNQATCTLRECIKKKRVLCTLQAKKQNKTLSPSITFLLPLLKKDDLETALYSLTEIGVTTIQLVTTKKTHVTVFTTKDRERAERIVISAAEQSKNFSYPEIKTPVNLQKALDNITASTKLFFDPQGNHLFSIIQNLHRDRPNDIVMLIGPEGDLSNEEKMMVAAKQFTVCALTSTTLRSVQAAALSAGLIRSLVI